MPRDTRDFAQILTNELVELIKSTVAETLAQTNRTAELFDQAKINFQDALYDYVEDRMNKFATK